MNYIDQWKALSSRIRGLVQAGKLHAQYLQVRSSDTYQRAKRLREQSESVLNEIQDFKTSFGAIIPASVIAAIDRFVLTTGTLITDLSGPPDIAQERVWAVLVSLSVFEAEISYLLSDVQESIHTRSELAFHHLQRSIVADSEFRNKWQNVFRAGEVACEKLGGVHLLLHGIWAFKVDASGARTDLVFQEPTNVHGVERYAAGLVLTEWKKAAKPDKADKCFRDARSQAKRYSQGPLAGAELTRYRYVIVVSEKQIEIPEDLIENDVVYRHINIAVAPSVPSATRMEK